MSNTNTPFQPSPAHNSDAAAQPDKTAHPDKTALDLTQDPALLCAALIDIESVSGNEGPLADRVEAALRALAHLEVHRDGDSIVARTNFGHPERVILAGHLDTVPLPHTEGSRGTVPASWDGETLYGRGATDMKGGVAVQLALAAALTSANRDVTYVYYDHEEVAAELSGLGRLARNAPELLEADFAILLEPTNGAVEGGCNGTMRFEARATGVAAHSARAWRGENAIHKLAPVLTALAAHTPVTNTVDGLDYRESLNAVIVSGGTATNVIPDAATVQINYRFSPDKSPEDAERYVREVLGEALDGLEFVRTDAAPGARPGLTEPSARSFVEVSGQQPQPKYGWTDVARFSAMGIPAINFGPGDALLAHTDDEHVSVEAIRACYRTLLNWLS